MKLVQISVSSVPKGLASERRELKDYTQSVPFLGRLFDQVDRATDLLLSVINRSVGVRTEIARAPVAYEIPPDVVREAVVNAVAHRDYALAGAVQVSVFADRVEVWNPGVLSPPLTLERLREPHGSVPRNARICEALFLARYIEKSGTGTLMMIHESVEHSLPEPEFAQRAGGFSVTVWRDWLTERVVATLGLNQRQRRALTHLKAARRITNQDYQEITGAITKTATRDLADMVAEGVVARIGKTGRGAYYVLARKGDTNGTNGTLAAPPPSPEKRDMNRTKETSTGSRRPRPKGRKDGSKSSPACHRGSPRR
mgnify:CR=1 FL=1